MDIILCSKELSEERALIHSFNCDEPEDEDLFHGEDDQSFSLDRPVLCTKEFADEYSLMHWRTKGSRNGFRRYQDDQGHLTPEGYQHYKEMYGWGDRPKTRLEKKIEKSQKRTDKSELALDKAKVKNDKARLAVGRKHSDRNQSKFIETSDRLTQAQLAYDRNRLKTNKYIQKAEKQANKYFNEDGSLNDKALSKYTRGEGDNSKMSLVGRLKFGNEFANDFNNRQRNLSEKHESTNDETIDSAAEDRVESSRYVEGSKAFADNADFWRNKVEKFNKLSSDEKREVENKLTKNMAESLEFASKKNPDDFEAEYQENAIIDYRNGLKAMQKNFDQLSPETRDYAAKAMAQIIDDKYTDSDSPIPKELREAINLGGTPGHVRQLKSADDVHDSIAWWVSERMDSRSGNMNTDEWASGSHGERAAKLVHEGWDKEESRAKEVGKKIGVTDDDAWWNSNSKGYEKLQKALKDDSLYKALKENSNKNGDALVKAVAQDMGFPTTPEVLKALEWYVWRD
jgi:hypothetical protein